MVPGVTAELVGNLAAAGVVCAEWDWTGTRADGTALHMRGVTILGVEADLVRWARFHMEPSTPTVSGSTRLYASR